MGGRTLRKEAGLWEKCRKTCHTHYSVLAPSCLHFLATVSCSHPPQNFLVCIWALSQAHRWAGDLSKQTFLPLKVLLSGSSHSTKGLNNNIQKGQSRHWASGAEGGRDREDKWARGVLPYEYYRTTISVCFLKKKKWQPLNAIFYMAFTLNPLNN